MNKQEEVSELTRLTREELRHLIADLERAVAELRARVDALESSRQAAQHRLLCLQREIAMKGAR